ncbi:MAG: hypothetical protein ABI612_22240 [Betaproteobacteria bacterium]
MAFERRDGQLAPVSRRVFLAASSALGAAFLLPPGSHAADIKRIGGPVTVNGKRATNKTPIRGGDTVQTGAGSMVVFVIGKDAFLLRQNARVTFDKADGDGAIGGLKVMNGGLLAVFDKGARRIQTANATAGIHGTGVYLEAHPDHTYFCTCYGEVDLRDKTGESHKLVVSGYHTANLIYAKPTNGKMIASVPSRHHTDEELIMLEKLVGRTSPILNRDQKLKEGAEPEQDALPKKAPEPKAEEPRKLEPEAKPEPQPKAQAQPKPEPRPEPSAKAESPLQSAPEAQAGPNPKPAPKSKAEAAPKGKKRAEKKPKPKVQKPEPKVQKPEPAPVKPPSDDDLPPELRGDPPSPPPPPPPQEPEYRLPPPRLD